MTAIEPFSVNIPQADVDDLRHRLRRTRWANELPPEEVAGVAAHDAADLLVQDIRAFFADKK